MSDTPQVGMRALVRAYAELTKIRLVSLVVATAAVGYLLASRELAGAGLAWTILGTALAAAGAMALNQAIEAPRDALMERTRHRPVPAGTFTFGHALAFGAALALLGITVLALRANPLTALLGLAVVLIYTLVYTPLKPRTPLCTLAGAVCGAIPPMMGWAAAAGRLDFGAWLLAGVLFLWQIPHFLALAWLYRLDYERGGFRMLPMVDREGAVTGLMAVLYAAALLPVGLAATLAGLAGWVYGAGSLALGAGLVACSGALSRTLTERAARRLFFATLGYLPLLLGLILADRSSGAAPVTVAAARPSAAVRISPPGMPAPARRAP